MGVRYDVTSQTSLDTNHYERNVSITGVVGLFCLDLVPLYRTFLYHFLYIIQKKWKQRCYLSASQLVEDKTQLVDTGVVVAIFVVK